MVEVGKAQIIKNDDSIQSNSTSIKQNNTDSVSIFGQKNRQNNGLSTYDTEGDYNEIAQNQLSDEAKNRVLEFDNIDRIHRKETIRNVERLAYFKENNYFNNDDKNNANNTCFIKQPPDVEINEKIENYEQSGTEGDCWLLASISALAGTEFGADAIKKAISKDKSGNYTVTLTGEDGEKEKYTFTPEQIDNAESRLSTGDDDVRLLELAVEQHQYNLIKNKNADPDNSKYIGDVATLANPLNSGYASNVSQLLTGISSKPLRDDFYINTTINIPFEEPINLKVYKHTYTEDCLDSINEDPENNCATVIFPNEIADKNIITDHSYAIKEVDEDNVTLTDPHDSSKDIIMSRKELINNNCYISFTSNNND